MLDWEKRALAWDAHRRDLRQSEQEAIHTAQLEEFRDRNRKKAQVQDALMLKLATKLANRIDKLKDSDIEVRTIAPLVRAIAAISDSATNAEGTALGVDYLAKKLEEPD